MAKEIKNERVRQSYEFPAKDIIRNPEISIETKGYPIGEQEYAILKQHYLVDWLRPVAFISFGIFFTQVYNLIAYLWQIYTHIEDTEELAQLKECQGDEIGQTVRILCVSLVVSIVLLIINKCVPTKKKKLLKKIRQVLDDNPCIIARKTEGETL